VVLVGVGIWKEGEVMAKINVISSEITTFFKPVEFEGFKKSQRIEKLNKIAISQMRILSGGDVRELKVKGDMSCPHRLDGDTYEMDSKRRHFCQLSLKSWLLFEYESGTMGVREIAKISD